jgi:hypothetical protein
MGGSISFNPPKRSESLFGTAGLGSGRRGPNFRPSELRLSLWPCVLAAKLLPNGAVMETLSSTFGHLKRRAFASSGLVLALFASSVSLRAATSPFLANLILTNSSVAQFQFTLYGDPNYSYAIEASKDLRNWTSVQTNRTFNYRVSVSVPATNDYSYFRTLALTNAPIPYLALGLAAAGNLDLNGKNFLSDSFDSSNTNYSSTIPGFAGQYDSSKAKAGGTVAVDGALVGDTNAGNAFIFGHLFTGPGFVTNQVEIGSQGSIGPLGTPNGTILNGWWSPNFNASFPDAPVPTFTSGLPLPTAVGGRIYLVPRINYIVSNSPSGVLFCTGPNEVWLKYSGSTSLGVTITNSGLLVLFVGQTGGSGDSLSLSGNGTMNYPGLASNLRIYGLPSLTIIDFHGNAGWCGTIYAPTANFFGGGGGSNTQDSIGAVVAKSITLNGNWNFHYDESLGYFGSPF